MRWLLPLWTLLAAVALAIHLGGYPLLDADEGRNGEVGREMAATNDYVMPRIDGMPYLDKPIVYFAAEAAAMEVMGASEAAARLPAYLFTLATAALLAWFGRRLWGGEEGWIAAIAFLSMPLTLAFARTVIFDSALTFFMVAAIVGFWLAVEEGGRRWPTLAWLAIGLGVITKGPVALAVPLLVAIPYAIRRRRFRALGSWGGLVAFVVVIAPWVWAVSRVVPDFLRYVLITETAARVATKALKRTGPPWYFIPYLLGGAFPWSFALFAERRGASDERDRNARLYLLLWVVIPFLFFSISQSKRPQYILPVMPAVALLAAWMWRGARQVPAARLAGIALAILGAILLVAPLAFHRTKMKSEIADVADESAYALGACTLVGGAGGIAFARRREVALAALSLPILAVPAVTNPLMNALALRRSTASLVAQVAPRLREHTEVVGVEAFTGSMMFYLGRPVIVATENASEFTSNYIAQHYAKFAGDPRSPVRPLPWLRATLGTPDRVYFVRNDDLPNRRLLEGAGMRLVASGAHFVVYGPAGRAGGPPAGPPAASPAGRSTTCLQSSS